MRDPYLPQPVRLVRNTEEIPQVHTLTLRFEDPAAQARFRFQCGQFNMLYLHGIGEIPISIMGADEHGLLHTIKAVGRVSRAMVALPSGSLLGLRGPFGTSWPLESAKGRDVLFITAGLGCAPVIAAIKRVIAEREEYGRILILQGVKHQHDMLWEYQYDEWRQVRDCQVLLAASEEYRAGPQWALGMVTVLLDKARFNIHNCVVMMCGPEPMLIAAVHNLLARGVPPECCFLSLERNMQCALGHCGHCQLGPHFICQDGPVFAYPQLAGWLERRGA